MSKHFKGIGASEGIAEKLYPAEDHIEIKKKSI